MRAIHVPAVAFAVTLVLVAGAPPCLGCSCALASIEEQFANAEVVFSGTLTARHASAPTGGYSSSGDPVRYVFDVQGVQKGNAASAQDVWTATDEASCGFAFRVGERYQVFAYTADGRLQTNICSGTKALGPDDQPDAGPGHTPAPDNPTSLSTQTPTPTPTRDVAAPVSAGGGRGGAAAAAAGLGVMAAAGAGGLIWLRLRGR